MSPFAWFKTSVLMSFALIAASNVRADMIVDTGPGIPTSAGLSLSAPHPGVPDGFQFVAGRFETSHAYEITRLSAYVRGMRDTNFLLGIASGPDVPTAATFTNLLTSDSIFVAGASSDWAGADVDNFVLPAGTWWIVASRQTVEGGSPGVWLTGRVASPLAMYAAMQSYERGWDVVEDARFIGSSLSAGFRIEASPVPLPAAGWLLLSGVGALFGFGKRRTFHANTPR